MNRKEKNPAGMILRAERIRQGKGQKEVCYGICVVSHIRAWIGGAGYGNFKAAFCKAWNQL